MAAIPAARRMTAARRAAGTRVTVVTEVWHIP